MENFETDINEIIVEFTGGLQSENIISNDLIQFTDYPDRHTFEIIYYERDEESQTYDDFIDIRFKVFQMGEVIIKRSSDWF